MGSAQGVRVYSECSAVKRLSPQSIQPKTIFLLRITKQLSDLQDSIPENYKRHP